MHLCYPITDYCMICMHKWTKKVKLPNSHSNHSVKPNHQSQKSMSCKAFSATGVSATFTATGASPIPVTNLALDTNSTGTVVNCVDLKIILGVASLAADIFVKVECDPTCTADPTVAIFLDGNCTASASAYGSFAVDSITSYTCGDGTDPSCGTATCQDAITKVPETTNTTTGAPVAQSGATSLRGKIIIGMMAAVVATLAVM